jgi:hypothetical protein
MPEYEIRILQPEGFPTWITFETQPSDLEAIRSARKLARRGHTFEVWCGLDCISGLASLPAIAARVQDAPI